MVTRILIAGGHHILRRGLRGLLETRPGWMVVAEAGDGYEAMTAAMETSPDVTILDCTLPRMNSLECARRIRQSLAWTESCLLADLAEQPAVVNALHWGIGGFVLKSDMEEELLSAVEALSKHRTYLSSGITSAMLQDYSGQKESPLRHMALTPREREIVQLVAEGMSNKQISKKLALSIKTVECHRGAAMRKGGWSSIADLVRYAVRNHLVRA